MRVRGWGRVLLWPSDRAVPRTAGMSWCGASWRDRTARAVTRNRKPLRLALEQLTDALVRAVIEAVHQATIGDILDFALSSPPAPAPRFAVAREPTLPALRPGRSRPASGRASRSSRSAEDAASVYVEGPPQEGTEINGLEMLTSLEAQAEAVQRRPQKKPVPLLDAPSPPEVARAAHSDHALRQGESVLRSGAGTVVIRRRRAS